MSQVSTKRIQVLGIPVDVLTMSSAIDLVDRMLDSPGTHLIFAVNPEKVMRAQQDPELASVLPRASLIVPDGIGVVLAARLQGEEQMERVPGSELMPAICQIAANQGRKVFLYGARPGVADRAKDILEAQYPRLQIVGTSHGYVAEEGMEALIDQINSSAAEILFVGLGSPRQELWMDRFSSRMKVKICQGVGGTFDALCGNPRRAPEVVRRIHLEWLYRLVTQPQRAGRQAALPRFAYRVIRDVMTRN